MFCTNCGKPLRDDARFCFNCGQAVSSAAPTSEPEPVPEQPAPVVEPTAPVTQPLEPQPAPEQPAPDAETAAPVTQPLDPDPVPEQPAPDIEAAPPKRKRTLSIVIGTVVAVVVVAALVVAGLFAFRFISDNIAFNKNMRDGEAHMADGHYSKAIDSYESALESKPGNADASLALARAYLCNSRFDDATELLSDMPALGEKDARLADWNRLSGLAQLSPSVKEVNTDAFPVVSVVFDRGGDLLLSAEHFTVTEDSTAREILGLEQDGQTMRLTYRSQDSGASEEPRDLTVDIALDGICMTNQASYVTPHFDPALLSLVSTDVSEYPRVKAYFRVTNQWTGENVENLDRNSFTILEQVEGGEYLSREVKSAMPLKDNAGLNIGLVADKSDSISSSDMSKIKSVMIEFVNSLNYSSGDRAELLAFDSIVQQMCYYTGDATLLTNGINNMSTDGLTAFYDAVYDGVTHAALQGGARCVIAFTDGQDNRSRYSDSEVIRYANQKQVPVYIIGVGRSLDTYTLRSMAEQTGGRYWHINDLYDLQEIFNQIYSEQKQLYVVEYESDAGLDSYLSRNLEVSVSGGGCRGESTMSFTPVRSINDGGVNRTSRYELFKESLSWEEASRRCQEMGGHLATITSQDEMDLLVGMAENAGVKYVWLGGYTSYDDHGNVFGHWVTGENFSYQAWSTDEPSRVDRDGAEEWYIMLWNIPHLGGWTWNDQRNDPAGAVTSMVPEMSYICEFEI